MRKIFISDETMKHPRGAELSFREKIELAKILDRLGADCIECAPIFKKRIDPLLIKSIASAVGSAAVAVPVGLTRESVDEVWAAVKEAKHPRLQVVAPVSTVQMEYFCHKKAPAMLEAVKEAVAYAAAKGCEVEFQAEDACRAEPEFLREILAAAIEAGAGIVTVCDTEGARLPNEIAAFVGAVKADIPALEGARLGLRCADDLSMADAAAIAAISMGADEVKACCTGADTASLENVARIIAARGGSMDASTSIRTTELSRSMAQISRMCVAVEDRSPYDSGVRSDGGEALISVHDSAEAVARAVGSLGYDLGEEDLIKVGEAVKNMGHETVSARELDAIVATVALQVPPSYRVENYMVNSGKSMKSIAQIMLSKDGESLRGVYAGDGPIDAAFMAVEQIIGKHYELDDFQIQAVTEGHEAMGETVVKLRSGGRLYSGRGISRDIIEASIRAYVNAVNKIVYEEATE